MKSTDPSPLNPAAEIHPDLEKRFCLALFFAALVLNVWFSSTGWNHSLRGVHEFRQVQTALSAHYLQLEGWQPAYPLPLFGPPWSAPFEFPFYQVMTAKFSSLTGLPLEQTGRAVALAFFYLALPAFFLLQEFLPIPPGRRLLLPALILLSPAYIYYSRSFMIESTALCAAAWFLLAFARALTRPGWHWVAAAAVLGALAGLAKSTTLVVFLVAAGVLAAACLRRQRRAGAGRSRQFMTLARAAAIIVPALAATVLWTRYTDTVKAANPLADFLMSDQVSKAAFGTLWQRFDAGIWKEIAGRMSLAVLGSPNAAGLVLFGLVLCRAGRGGVAALLLCFASGPLIFANLYAVHDYYFYASGVFALAALAVSWSNLLDLTVFPLVARYTVIVLSLAVQVGSYTVTYGQSQHQPTVEPPELAVILRQATGPEDVVLVLGQDWNPLLAYYAGRRAIMVTDHLVDQSSRLDDVLRRVGAGRVTAMVITGELRKYPKFTQPLANRLGLQPDPVLMDADTQLYLSSKDAGEAMVRISRLPLKSFSFINAGAENLALPRHRYPAAGLADPRIGQLLGPTLGEIAHPFNITVHELDGRPVIDAHVPTDLIFELASGQTEIVMEFGLLPGSWQGPQVTDGVEFRVELHTPTGRRLILFSQLLQPGEQPADRGTKRATVKVPDQTAGQVRLRTLPGPKGSIACDWAYWGKVDIH